MKQTGLPSPVKSFLSSTIALAASLAGASARQICIPFPQKSSADFLIGADTVVLAREAPARPFHLEAVKVLKGEPGTSRFDLFLDSSSHRLLSLNPDRSIVVVRRIENGEEAWQRVGTADQDFAPLVGEILKRAPSWQADAKLRPKLFAKLLGYANPQVSKLAQLEVARAPYSDFRSLDSPLDRGDRTGGR